MPPPLQKQRQARIPVPPRGNSPPKMPAQPSITVLLPTYNDARFLSATIGSILNQTFGDFELLVVDDGSTDETRGLLDRVSDPRVRVLRNPTNCGLTFSLNRGLDAARGRYVARMDADD